MILQVYSAASEFLEKTQNHLLIDEAANNLMLGLAVRLKHQPETFKQPPYLATVEKNGEMELAALMTPPYSMILFSPGKPNLQAYEAIAQDLFTNHWNVTGVNAVPEISNKFAGVWCALAGVSSRPRIHMQIYKLEKVTWPPAATPGRLRQAAPEDLPLVEEWLYLFHKEALKEDDRQRIRKMAEDVVSAHNLHFWEIGGQPVSMAAGRRPSPYGIVISLVYTPPELRSRGYASACVANLCQYYLDAGKLFCSLFADRGNLVSNKIYRQIGFRPVGEFLENLFEER